VGVEEPARDGVIVEPRGAYGGGLQTEAIMHDRDRDRMHLYWTAPRQHAIVAAMRGPTYTDDRREAPRAKCAPAADAYVRMRRRTGTGRKPKEAYASVKPSSTYKPGLLVLKAIGSNHVGPKAIRDLPAAAPADKSSAASHDPRSTHRATTATARHSGRFRWSECTCTIRPRLTTSTGAGGASAR